MKKIRVTIDMNPALHERLEAMEVATEAGSKADVIRHALRLYGYVIDRTNEGYSFLTESPTGKQEKIVILTGVKAVKK